ncbi:uncharacterized protein LOC127650793 [Xyrauchen texanus]|uniref:uncharacterized protein LOC127650793 n=1 Tax=Xyrauchen texanus TaxID=154827 RepID=UPI0022426E97|nr:uncharacterized protein LOC127650793 [Xyrauchen texanus]
MNTQKKLNLKHINKKEGLHNKNIIWGRSTNLIESRRLSAPAPCAPAPCVPAPCAPAPGVPAPCAPAPCAPDLCAPDLCAPAPCAPAPGVPAPCAPAPCAPDLCAPDLCAPAPCAPAPGVPAPCVPAPCAPAPGVPAPCAPAPCAPDLCAPVTPDMVIYGISSNIGSPPEEVQEDLTPSNEEESISCFPQIILLPSGHLETPGAPVTPNMRAKKDYFTVITALMKQDRLLRVFDSGKAVLYLLQERRHTRVRRFRRRRIRLRLCVYSVKWRGTELNPLVSELHLDSEQHLKDFIMRGETMDLIFSLLISELTV